MFFNMPIHICCKKRRMGSVFHKEVHYLLQEEESGRCLLQGCFLSVTRRSLEGVCCKGDSHLLQDKVRSMEGVFCKGVSPSITSSKGRSVFVI